MAEIKIESIGLFHGPRKSKSAIPRQGRLSKQVGFIQLNRPGFDCSSALRGLERMTHCWVIFSFHEAQSDSRANPKPLVRPPRKPEIQVGVWATRSPYRPNSLGLTLARIEKIKDRKIYLSEVDLLDQTPIFDIKPYVAESDRPQKPFSMGWIDEIEEWKYQLKGSAQKKRKWLSQNGMPEIDDVIESQFGTPPLQNKRKRVKKQSDHWILSYRTWRVHFLLHEKKRKSVLIDISSGYSPFDLESDEDAYQDKDLHRQFLRTFR